MTTSILVAIGVMFIPVAMLNFDKGEAKTTGGIVFVAGIITLVGAFFTAVVYKDNLGAALFFSFAILYLVSVHPETPVFVRRGHSGGKTNARSAGFRNC